MKNLILFVLIAISVSSCRSVYVNNSTSQPVPVKVDNSAPLQVTVLSSTTSPTRFYALKYVLNGQTGNLKAERDLIIQSIYSSTASSFTLRGVNIPLGGSFNQTYLSLQKGEEIYFPNQSQGNIIVSGYYLD